MSELLRKKVGSGKPVYMIQWQGYCPSQNTWEPRVHLPAEMIENLSVSLQTVLSIIFVFEGRDHVKKQWMDRGFEEL